MTALERYREFLAELLRLRMLAPLSDEEEERVAVALNDCRRAMTPEEEAEVEVLVAKEVDRASGTMTLEPSLFTPGEESWSAADLARVRNVELDPPMFLERGRRLVLLTPEETRELKRFAEEYEGELPPFLAELFPHIERKSPKS